MRWSGSWARGAPRPPSPARRSPTRRGGRPRFGRRLLLADGIGVVILGAVGLFMGLPYLHVLQQHPEAQRTLADVAVFSPPIRAFITAPSQSLPWGAAHDAARATMIAPA